MGLKKSSSVLVFSILLQVSTFAFAQQDAQETANFLIQMGYENYVQQAQSTLRSAKLTEIQKKVLEKQVERLQVFNTSRELTSYFFSLLPTQFEKNERLNVNLQTLTARLLNFGLRGLPDELPPEIQNIRDTQLRELEAEKYIKSYIEVSINLATRELLSDLIAVLYEHTEVTRFENERDVRYLEMKAKLAQLVSEFVVSKHLHLETSHRRELGRAFALTLVRYYRLHQLKNQEQRFERIVLHHGEILGNYISSDYVIAQGVKNQDSKVNTLKFKTGDLVSSYHRALEETIAGVRTYPKSWITTFTEFISLGLGFQSVKALIPWENKINTKKLRGQKLTWTESLVSAFLNLPIFRRGQNTIALTEVKTDSRTGLKTVWLFRSLGNDGPGGIQVEDVRNFILPGFIDRLSHERLDGDRIVNLNLENKNNEAFHFGNDTRGLFQSEVNQAEKNKILSESADRYWIEEKLGPLAISAMKSMMVGKNAVGNSWGAEVSDYKLSSGQAIRLAYYLGTGLEVSNKADQVKLTYKVNGFDQKQVDKSHIFSPSHWSWNKISNVVNTIEFNKKNPLARVVEFYGTTRAPMNHKIFATIHGTLDQIQVSESGLNYVVSWAKRSAEYQDILTRAIHAESKTGWDNLDQTKNMTTEKSATRSVLSEQEMRDFLFDLGFHDLSKEIKDAYDRNETYSEGTKLQQQRNIKSYQMLNASRELAILLMEKSQNNISHNQGAQQFAEMITYLMSQQPSQSVKKIPEEILNTPENRRDDVFDKYVADQLRKTMLEHTRTMTADLLWYLYGEKNLENISQFEIKKIHDLVSVIVERMYLDVQVGQTRFAGRALLALYARYAEKTKTEDRLMPIVDSALDRVGLELNNFIGDEWKLKSHDGKGTMKIKVQTLSFVMNRLIDQISASIPWGAQPDKSLLDRAKKNDLVGNPLSMLFPNSASGVKSGYGTMEALKDQATYEILSQGYSHIGYVIVNEAKNSKIKMSWIVDSYPHLLVDTDTKLPSWAKHNAGGLRFVGLEQFYLTSHHSRFLVADHDPVEFHKLAMEQIKKTGLPRTGENRFPYKIYESQFQQNMKHKVLTNEEAKETTWPIETSQDKLNILYSQKDPHKFWQMYQAEVKEGLFEEIKRGMTFLWITPAGRYEKGTSFCSSLLSLTSLRKTGLNPEFVPGRWISLLGVFVKAYKALEKAGYKHLLAHPKIQELITMANMEIISPSSLAAQKFVTKYYNVLSATQGIITRLKDDWSSRITKSKKIKQLVDSTTFNNSRDAISTMKFDASEVRSVSFQWTKTLEVRDGKINSEPETVKNILIAKQVIQAAVDKKLIENESDQKRTASISGLRCEAVFVGR